MSPRTDNANRASTAFARALVRDLRRPKPWIYWMDFVACVTVGYSAASLYLATSLSVGKAVAFLVAGFALYRLASFLHEIVHLRRREMPAFRLAWDLLAGVPLLMPSHFYESHAAHHNAHDFGTERDGEYLPLGRAGWRASGELVLQVLLLPLAMLLRFAVLTPLTWLHPGLRRWTRERASSFVINVRYRLPDGSRHTERFWLEAACWLRATAMLVGPLVGVTSWERVPQLYLLAVFTLGLNYLRTFAAHHYRHEGQASNHADQIGDSLTITGGWLTELLCPLGMRYHALHHWLPNVPYYHLGVAHRRLLRELPADAAYRRTIFPTFWSALRHRLGYDPTANNSASDSAAGAASSANAAST